MRRRALEAAVRACGPSSNGGERGACQRRETGGIQYSVEALAGGPARSSCEAAARWGGGGAKGLAHQECRCSFEPADGREESEDEQAKAQSRTSRLRCPSSWSGEAYRRVAANKGCPGVDGQDLAEFEADLEGQPLQDLEPDELRLLLSTTGQGS